MTKSIAFFDAGAGAKVREAGWRKAVRAFARDGVVFGYLDELEPFADDSGLVTKMMAGGANINGSYYEDDAVVSVSHDPNSSGLDRIDRVALRMDTDANTIEPVVIQGTPALNPDPPAYTFAAASYDLPVAQFLIADGDASLAAGTLLHDERRWANPPDPLVRDAHWDSDRTVDTSLDDLVSTAAARPILEGAVLELWGTVFRVDDTDANNGYIALNLTVDGNPCQAIRTHDADDQHQMGHSVIGRYALPATGTPTFALSASADAGDVFVRADGADPRTEITLCVKIIGYRAIP